jgi:protein-L-isoaspartate(D-aspartate) O-methyltransferase
MDLLTEAEQRKIMVQVQLLARNIQDKDVLAVMGTVPRHRFVPVELRDQAYEDHPLKIACSQTISQPYMVACMVELLHLKPTDRVLEIGTGSGYQTAILAELAAEVVTMERHALLAEEAGAVLDALGYDNVRVMVADGSVGCPEEAPFDAIIVAAASPRVPLPLQEQLAPGGRLVCPVGSRTLQELHILDRHEDGFHQSNHTKCVFVPLLGQEGWRVEEA